MSVGSGLISHFRVQFLLTSARSRFRKRKNFLALPEGGEGGIVPQAAKSETIMTSASTSAVIFAVFFMVSTSVLEMHSLVV